MPNDNQIPSNDINNENKAKAIKLANKNQSNNIIYEINPYFPNSENKTSNYNNISQNIISNYEKEITETPKPMEQNAIISNENNGSYNQIIKETTQNNLINKNLMPIGNLSNVYYFNVKGLYNIGSTCYMNSTLQCLLHMSELIYYFLNQFPKDFPSLKLKNKDIPTHGDISKVFYELVKRYYPPKNIAPKNNSNTNEIILKANTFNKNYNMILNPNNNTNAISPEAFQKVIGNYNHQFRNLEANDSKDLILYLLQSIHAELNYFTGNKTIEGRPNQYNRGDTFKYFIYSYDIQNYSIISLLFYGTYENITKCKKCRNILYNFQKFEFLSFGTIDYVGKEFNIYNGFEDHQKVQELKGDNQFYCNICKHLQDVEICCKIVSPPYKLLINIDYGKNKKFIPGSVKFDEEIDITKYVSFNFGFQIKYRIIGVCTHYGDSGSYGHYIAFCRNRNNEKWYVFNDLSCKECSKNSIYSGTPYLLLYERIP